MFSPFKVTLSAVQLLKLRARFLWRVSFKLLLGRRFGLQNGLEFQNFYCRRNATLHKPP
jgi:ligand-binding sensor domain-containing protein